MKNTVFSKNIYPWTLIFGKLFDTFNFKDEHASNYYDNI